jgi:hypothetical protein
MPRHPKIPPTRVKASPKAKRAKRSVHAASAFWWCDLFALCLIVAGGVWLAGLAFEVGEPNNSDLRIIQAKIDEFTILHGDSPRSSAELKAYLRSEAYEYNWHDRHGNPAEYIRIGGEYYVLQRLTGSRGSDFEYVPQVVYRLPGIHSYEMKQEYGESLLGIYPFALLIGANSPDGQHHARVLLDPDSARRYLVVTDVARFDRAWIAPHDFVEEFMWLPGGAIAYTATSSARYDDGAFLWDFQSNRNTNLRQQAQRQGPGITQEGQKGRVLSLIGASEAELFVVDLPDSHEFASSKEFFAPSNITVFNFKKSPIEQRNLAAASTDAPLIQVDRIFGQLKWSDDPKYLQTEHGRLLRLGLDAPLESKLNKWQSYCQDQKNSVTYPYCLWMLESMYVELAKDLKDQSQQAEIAAAYALEISRALADNPVAPKYIRTLAHNGVDRMTNGELP